MGLFNRGPRPVPNRSDPPEPVFDEPLEVTAVADEPEAPDVPTGPSLADELAAAERAIADPEPDPVSEPEAEPKHEPADEHDDAVDVSPEGESAVETELPRTPEPAPEPERERPPVNLVAADEPEDGEKRISASEAIAPSRSQSPSDAPGADGAPSRRATVISFANQKGGVAKTTTTLNLAVAFAESGHDVLCIDLDPQGNLTMSQGIDPDKVDKSMFDVLVHHIPIRDVIQQREIDIAVASIDLAGAEIAMSTQIGRERSLEKAISAVADEYDFVCIDTPPSLGLLTINALTASDKVIVPVQCEYLSMRGLLQLQNTLEMIQDNLNPRVKIEGILPTMLDSRTVHAKEAVEILEENFGDLVFKSRIRKAIKFAEAPVRGSSVLKYDPKGNAADYYRELAKEVLTNGAS
jgi:chromosome partitioning protein